MRTPRCLPPLLSILARAQRVPLTSSWSRASVTFSGGFLDPGRAARNDLAFGAGMEEISGGSPAEGENLEKTGS